VRATGKEGFLAAFVEFLGGMKQDKRNKYPLERGFLKALTLKQLEELIAAYPELLQRQLVASSLFEKTFWKELQQEEGRPQTR
jgi:hypothetical protein